MHRRQKSTLSILGLILIAALVLAGCGRRGGQSEAGGSAAEPVVPTMPAAQFAQPTTMITVAPGDAVTETSETEEAAATPEVNAETAAEPTSEAAEGAAEEEEGEAEAEEPAGAELTAEQARGLELYSTRKCPDCHGPNAEGVADKGSSLAGSALNLDEFTDLLRTGGDVGADHIFGPMMISPSGVNAIHAWIQTLPAE